MPVKIGTSSSNKFMVGTALATGANLGLSPYLAGNPPVNVTLPTISGIPFPGGLLTVSGDTWTGSGIVKTFQWNRGGVAISGATASTYTGVLADEGQNITCTVTATNAAGSANATSAAVKVGVGLLALNAASNQNVTTSINSTFVAGDVDTVGNKINLTGLPLAHVSNSQVTPVMLSTTGALPAPLQVGVQYYAKNVAGGIRIYRRNTDAHFASLNGFVSGESVVAAAEYGFDQPVVLTTGGSGTHTIYTNTVASTLKDVSGNGYDYVQTQVNAMMEILSDVKGPYINMEGVLGLSQTVVSEPFYGKGHTSANGGLAMGNKRAGKRYLAVIGAMAPSVSTLRQQKRVILDPSRVNAATGVFTNSFGHGLTTGHKMKVGAFGSGAFPTPTVSMNDPCFARAIDTVTFSLHPTAADATNNTNKYVFSNTGSGVFHATDTEDVVQFARQMLFDLCQNPNDHYFSPQTAQIRTTLDFTNVQFNMAMWFPGNASYNGDLPMAQLTPVGGWTNDWSILKVDIFIPPGSIGWTCSDTGTPLTTGTYYITKKPVDVNYVRLHRTLTDAQNSVGVATNVCACIKYPNTEPAVRGYGKGSMTAPEKTIFKPFDDGATFAGNVGKLSNLDEFGIYTQIVDFVGDGTDRLWTIGKDSLSNLANAVAMTNTVAAPGGVIAGTASSSLILGDAAEYHVPGKAKIYEMYVVAGTDPTDFNNQMNMAMTALKAKYGVV